MDFLLVLLLDEDRSIFCHFFPSKPVFASGTFVARSNLVKDAQRRHGIPTSRLSAFLGKAAEENGPRFRGDDNRKSGDDNRKSGDDNGEREYGGERGEKKEYYLME